MITKIVFGSGHNRSFGSGHNRSNDDHRMGEMSGRGALEMCNTRWKDQVCVLSSTFVALSLCPKAPKDRSSDRRKEA